MTNYIINIDKLKLIFNNENTTLTNNYNFEFIKQPLNNYSRTHKENYIISYKEIPFCFLSHKDNLRPSYSKLYIKNEILYTDNFNDILINFLTSFNITDYQISDIEISINTNKKLLRNYYNHYLNNKIILNKNYNSYSFLPTQNRFTNIVSNDTIYIKNNKSTLITRIENKTKEIKEHSKKQYILNYYSNKGLNITKDIYRLEMRIDLVNLRRGSRYTQYQNNTIYSDIITLKQFTKLDYITQSRYKKITLSNPYIIDITQLNDEVYLTKLFNTLTPFNYEKLIIPITFEKITFENTTKQTIVRTPIIKNNDYEKEFNNIFDLFN